MPTLVKHLLFVYRNGKTDIKQTCSEKYASGVKKGQICGEFSKYCYVKLGNFRYPCGRHHKILQREGYICNNKLK